MHSRPSITTRIGDKGTTQLFSGETVSKNAPQTHAYGDLDEVVSLLGIARSLTPHATTAERLIWLQRELFVLGAELATSTGAKELLGRQVDDAMLATLDQEREALEATITMPTGFVLPGGTPAAAQLDLARAVTRRCERRTVGLVEVGLLENPLVVVWLNRCSDYLWLLARAEEGDATLLKNG